MLFVPEQMKFMENKSLLTIEVIYAAPKLFHYTLEVAHGTTILEAIRQSPLLSDCPSLMFESMPVGIFGKKVLRPLEQTVCDGDRIELYRPITANPKALRKQRAKTRQN